MWFFWRKSFKNLNPNEGTFVFWGALDDFITYAEASPTEVANIWNQLYDDSIPLKDRIDQFKRSKFKHLMKKLNLMHHFLATCLLPMIHINIHCIKVLFINK